MRIRFGRPDVPSYAGRFGVPAADAGSPVSVTFLGVSSLLLDDGTSAILTDGFFSRPRLRTVVTRRLAPDPRRIEAGLRRAGIDRLDAVIPVHGHVDHALDSAAVAGRTGAVVVGGRTVRNIALGHGLAAERIRDVASGDTVRLGAWTVTFLASRHCPPDRAPGEVTEPLRSPARRSAYRCGEAWSLLVGHDPSGRTALVQGSAGFVPGLLEGRQADVAYLGVGQLGLRPVPEIRRYWQETAATVGARRAVLIHWDDFFVPLEHPPKALPYAGDDLNTTLSTLDPLAEKAGVHLTLPKPWTPEDPWR